MFLKRPNEDNCRCQKHGSKQFNKLNSKLKLDLKKKLAFVYNTYLCENIQRTIRLAKKYFTGLTCK